MNFELNPVTVTHCSKLEQKRQTFVTLRSITQLFHLHLVSIIYVPIRPNRSTSEADEIEDAEEK